MRFASFFSGIGGFEIALSRAGHECVYSCEIDDFPRAVFEARFGHAPAGKDICDVDPGEIPDAELWCGGFPCQDVSTAGKRRGVFADRSGLVWRFLDLAAERRPQWILLENVPGLLTGTDGAVESDDEDVGEAAEDVVSWFGALLGALVELGYVGSARVLDARFFGVPQRRRRIFILARRAGEGPRPEEVLFEPESLRGRPAPRRASRQDSPRAAQVGAGAGELYSCSGPGKWTGDPGTVSAHEAKEPHHLVAGALRASDGGVDVDHAAAGHLVGATVQAHHGRGAPDDQLVTEEPRSGGDPLRQGLEEALPDPGQPDRLARGGGASPATPRATGGGGLLAATVRADDSYGHRGDGSDNLIAATLTSGGHPGSAIPGRHREDDVNLVACLHPDAAREGVATTPSADALGRVRLRDPGLGVRTDGSAYTLGTGEPPSVAVVPLQDASVVADKGQNGLGIGKPGDPMFALQAQAQHGVIAFDPTQVTHPENRSRCEPGEDSPSLAAKARPPHIAYSIVPEHGTSTALRAAEIDMAPAVTTRSDTSRTDRGTRVVHPVGVRRLTPRECERLQGLPDDHTLIIWNGKPAPDSLRYKAIGNGVAIPVVEWIGWRLKAVEARA